MGLMEIAAGTGPRQIVELRRATHGSRDNVLDVKRGSLQRRVHATILTAVRGTLADLPFDLAPGGDGTPAIGTEHPGSHATQLQRDLESQHMNRFVAIEPESGEYFLGDTFDEAVKSARTKYPSRLSHTTRIGQSAAFHIGVLQR
jgi:hypothetical protein